MAARRSSVAAWLAKLQDRLRGNPHKVRWLVSRVLHRTRLCQLLTMDRDGLRYRFYPSSLSLTLWFDPTYGREDREVVRAIVRDRDVVVDVGANIGTISLEAARAAGPAGRVIAYEPHPRTHRYLLGNARRNRLTTVEARQVALGAERGEVRLSDDRADDMNAVTSAPGIVVPVATLDEDLAELGGPIGLLKVDVEGYELPVLRGGSRTLARSRCVYVEIAEAHFARFGYHVEDVLELLARSGFELYRRSGAGWARIGTARIPDGVLNVLGVRRAAGEPPAVGSPISLSAIAAAG